MDSLFSYKSLGNYGFPPFQNMPGQLWILTYCEGRGNYRNTNSPICQGRIASAPDLP